MGECFRNMQQVRRSRQKPIKSCLECNRRKQKCNRQKPCNHCRGRGVEHRCVYSFIHTQQAPSRGRNRQPRREKTNLKAIESDDQHSSTTSTSYESDSREPEMDGLEALRYASAECTQEQLSNYIEPACSEVWPLVDMVLDNWHGFTDRKPHRNFPLMTAAKNCMPSSRSRSRPRRTWPERPVADFLVCMFLQEINRTYEMIYAPSFHSQYSEWWALRDNVDGILEGGISDDDVDFGLLILRVCLLSIQCLPHSRYPTAGILDISIEDLEEWFYSLANEIEKTQSAERKPTMVTVQHRFYHVCYLRNYAKIRKCWAALSVTVKDAHEMGLHLKDPGIPLSDLSMELRRRAFWNLYVIDRFMCTLFGYWPLIPEGYFDIDLPHDSLRTITVRPYVLTTFTDRIFYIKVARYLTAFTSPPSWVMDQYDPVLVSEFAQRFKEVVVDQLPPAYWLDNPDTRWDAAEPALLPKRETLHLFIYSAKASLYRAFADPCNNLHNGGNTRSRYGTDLLALSHRRTLMDISCKVISSITRLYVLTGDDEGGTCEQMFLFPILLVEALACLGVCLLSIQADTRRLSAAGIRFGADSDLRYSYATFFDAFGLLSRQVPQNEIAKRGLDIMEGLHDTLHSSPGSPNFFRVEDYRNAATGREPHAMGCFHLEQALMTLHGQGSGELSGRVFFPLPEWMSTFFDSPGRCWLFRDQSAFGDLLA